MMVAGPLSDRIGRLPVLKIAAVLFALSAIASAVAPDFLTLVVARLVGGLGVGAALIIAPMYIAELAPAHLRGRMVSFNQLNIVIGISAAFFSNYLILSLADSDQAWVQQLGLARWNWRWMLGIEALPAILYFVALYTVPESPRWLAMHGKDAAARDVLARAIGPAQADVELRAVKEALATHEEEASLGELFRPTLRRVLTLGILVAVLQQITGINAVFFYAPMIFQQSGVGTDAAFMQAIFVGLINLVFTVLAISLIDRLGRRPLLIAGLAGIAASMLLLAYGFGSASLHHSVTTPWRACRRRSMRRRSRHWSARRSRAIPRSGRPPSTALGSASYTGARVRLADRGDQHQSRPDPRSASWPSSPASPCRWGP